MIIKLKFTKHGEPFGREYSYLCNHPVEVGDTADIERIDIGYYYQTNVPEIEIEPFKDKVKAIMGIKMKEEK